MEQILPINVMLFCTFAFCLVLEIVRVLIFSALKLNLNWKGGLRYPYYLAYLTLTAGFGPALATVVIWLLTLLWIYCSMSLPYPLPIYASGFFLAGLAGIVMGLLYAVILQVRSWQKKHPPSVAAKGRPSTRKGKPSRRFYILLAGLPAVALFLFVVEPLRWIVGGLLLVLATSAAGQMVRFTGWEDLVQWIRRSGAQGKPAQKEADEQGEGEGAEEEEEDEEDRKEDDRMRVRLFVVAEGYLSRRGSRIEVQGEELASPDDNLDATLARHLLDRSRLTEIVGALDMLQQRDDLLAEMPKFIARNLSKFNARREALSESGKPEGENRARLEAAIRTRLEQELGTKLYSLLYWHYGLPSEEVNLSVHRLPQFEIKPLITLREYLGLFSSWWVRRRRD